MQIEHTPEVTPEYNKNEKEEKRLKALEYLKKVSQQSKLGLYNEEITREDAHRDFLLH